MDPTTLLVITAKSTSGIQTMPFKCVCPGCGNVVEARDDWVGQRHPCANCGNQILIRKDHRLSQLGLNEEDDATRRREPRPRPSKSGSPAATAKPTPVNPPPKPTPERPSQPAPNASKPTVKTDSPRPELRRKPSIIPNEPKPTVKTDSPRPELRRKPSIIPNEPPPKPSDDDEPIGLLNPQGAPGRSGSGRHASPAKEEIKINKYRGHCPQCTRPMLNDGSPCICGFTGDPASFKDAAQASENVLHSRGESYTDQHLRKLERFQEVKRKIQYAMPFVAGVIGGLLGGILGAILMLIILSALTAVVMAVLQAILFPYRPSSGKPTATTREKSSVRVEGAGQKAFGCLILALGAPLLWLALACLDHRNLGGAIPFGLFGFIFLIIGFKNLFGK